MPVGFAFGVRMRVVWWDADGSFSTTTDPDTGVPVRTMCVDPETRVAAMGAANGEVWTLRNGFAAPVGGGQWRRGWDPTWIAPGRLVWGGDDGVLNFAAVDGARGICQAIRRGSPIRKLSVDGHFVALLLDDQSVEIVGPVPPMPALTIGASDTSGVPLRTVVPPGPAVYSVCLATPRVYVGRHDGTVEVWSIERAVLERRYRVGCDPVDALGRTADGRYLVGLVADGIATFRIDLQTGEVTGRALPGERPFGDKGASQPLAVHPTAPMAAVLDADGEVCRLDLAAPWATGVALATASGPRHRVALLHLGEIASAAGEVATALAGIADVERYDPDRFSSPSEVQADMESRLTACTVAVLLAWRGHDLSPYMRAELDALELGGRPLVVLAPASARETWSIQHPSATWVDFDGGHAVGTRALLAVARHLQQTAVRDGLGSVRVRQVAGAAPVMPDDWLPPIRTRGPDANERSSVRTAVTAAVQALCDDGLWTLDQSEFPRRLPWKTVRETATIALHRAAQITARSFGDQGLTDAGARLLYLANNAVDARLRDVWRLARGSGFSDDATWAIVAEEAIRAGLLAGPPGPAAG